MTENIDRTENVTNSNKKMNRKRTFEEAFPFRRISVRKRQQPVIISDDQQLQIENETEITNNDELFCLEGRRIVSIKYFLEILGKIADHNDKSFGCRYRNLKCIGERRKGFISKLHFKCELCNSEFDISTEDPSNTCDVNHGIVAGIISIGCGLGNLNELAGNTDIPGMSKNLYAQTSKKVYEWFHKTAVEEMSKAGIEEAEHATEIGSVDCEGTPMIDVIADGCWSKRSFRNNYSASSGAAAIIGAYSGKILYLGVKNKYCIVCAKAENKKIEPANHICYKNYSGSSSSMESTSLVEGFANSLQTHGLIYARLISDGDSSTHKKILESNPYKNCKVQKIECRNHLLRNLCNKLRALTKDTHIPIQLRKLLTDFKIMKLRRYTVRAIKLRKHEDISDSQKMVKLRADILNALRHSFGSHSDCDDAICPATDKTDRNTALDVVNTVLWRKMSQIILFLAANAKSLIFDVDSNPAETFNSVIAKYVGGKRINYTLKNSYQERCSASVISFNTKRPINAIHKCIFDKPTGKYTNVYEAQKAKRKIYKRLFRKKIRRNMNDPDYGQKAQRPDMTDEDFQMTKDEFLKQMELSDQQRDELQKQTIDQSSSQEWLENRKNRLTASMFGKICKRKENISCAPLVKAIVKPQKLSNIPSITYGRDNEQTALTQLSLQENVTIARCGLFIHKTLQYLGASPDGIYKDKDGKTGLVEVKCPFSAKNMQAEEAIKTKKIKFWKFNTRNNTIVIDKNHDYYFQIQGQLNITEMDICLFAVWTGEEYSMKVDYIKRDATFWHDKMVGPLSKFYLHCLLPELVDSRLERSMPIKDPPYIIQAIEKKVKNNNNASTSSTADAVVQEN